MEYWDEAEEIKNDLRRMTVKIESFVRRAKSSLAFAINATKNKKLFEWMASVERALATISTEIDGLLVIVSDAKARIYELKKKVMKDATNAVWWSVTCCAISVIGVVVGVAAGLAISVVAAPFFVPVVAVAAGGSAVGALMGMTAARKYATASELQNLEDGLGKIEHCMDKAKADAEGL